MKKSVLSIIIVSIAIILVIVSCGDDYILQNTSTQTSFETVIDYTEYLMLHAIVESADGNIVVGGQKTIQVIDSAYSPTDSTGNYQAFIVKLNMDGDTIWTCSFGDSILGESVEKIVLNSDGSFFVLASQFRMRSMSSPDLYLQKISADGELGSYEIIDGISFPYIEDMIQTEDNGYIIIGKANGYRRTSDMVVIKVNSYGLQSWNKIYARGEFNSVKLLDDGNLLVAGTKIDTISYSSNIYVMKLNSVGDSLEATELSIGEHNYVKEVASVDNNKFKVFGTTNSPTSAVEFIMNLDSAMSPTNVKLHYDLYSTTTRDCKSSSDNSAIFAGYRLSPTPVAFLNKYDASDNLVWQQLYDKTGFNILTNFVIPLSNGGYAMTGRYQNTSTLESTGFIIKTDPQGNVDLE